MYWIISDTHFGHRNLEHKCNRPILFEKNILNGIKSMVKNSKKNDVLIHLGDIAFKNELVWHDTLTELFKETGIKRWLVLGNHDNKSNHWYLNNGWDFVGENITIKYKNKIILFSHKPIKDNGYDFNIHGHFHNSDPTRHEPELVAIKNSKQILFCLEDNYKPISLDKLTV